MEEPVGWSEVNEDSTSPSPARRDRGVHGGRVTPSPVASSASPACGRRATHTRALTASRLRSILFLLLAGSLASLALPPRVGAQGVPPDAEWSTFDTEHFRIIFTDGLEPLARRTADRAERAFAQLASGFVAPPRERIEVLIANNTDYSNGFASPFPRNRIVLYAHPPADEPTLAYYTDWLDLLVLHELVHIFHMDHAGEPWKALRFLFGRQPVLFPQIFTPGWMIEGLATYFESEYTFSGRVRGTMYDMVLRSAILEGAFFSLDRATLDPVSWPGASTRYIYGALFVDHLARRFGPEKISEFIIALGSRLLPYRLDATARQVFGVTLSDAWRSWEEELRQRYAAVAEAVRTQGVTEPEILTEEGYLAYFPRYSPDGSAIAYAASTGREESALRLLESDGRSRTITRRSTTGAAAWLPGSDELLYSQLDFVGPYRVLSDLYRAGTARGERRLTEGARIWSPDPHPDGDRSIAVLDAAGTNALGIIDHDAGTLEALTQPDLDIYWSAPRFSPEGDRIAVSRWQDEFFDVVILDGNGRLLHQVTRDRAVDSNPAWSPDGRYLLFASDRTGISNLYAFELETGLLWQVTNLLSGAFQPDISPDGSSIVFSLYRSDGYHIARIPFDPERWWRAPLPAADRFDPAPAREIEAQPIGPIRPYYAWSTLLPTSWSTVARTDPGLGWALGVALAGEDVIGRHLWSASALGYLNHQRLDAGAAYRYRGWGNPVLDLGAEQLWSVQAHASDEDPSATGDLLRRDREGALTLSWLDPHWRSSFRLLTGFDVRQTDLVRDAPGNEAGRRSFPLDVGSSLGFTYSSLRTFERSIGPQQGILLAPTLQARRFLGAAASELDSQSYWRATTRALGFRAVHDYGFAPAIFAARLHAGIEGTSNAPGFSLGGTAGADPIALERAGVRGTDFPVRGYPAGARQGNRIVSASVEYRFPIVLVERGVDLFPAAIQRLWGDLFLDAGTAWCTARCLTAAPAGDLSSTAPLLSAGAEIILDLRLGYYVDLPLRAGIAFPLTERRDPFAFYLRLGSSF